MANILSITKPLHPPIAHRKIHFFSCKLKHSTLKHLSPTPPRGHSFLSLNHHLLHPYLFTLSFIFLIASKSLSMAEQHQPHTQTQQQQPASATKTLLPERGPSSSQVLAVITLFPFGGLLLLLAGITLTGTLIGLAVATPLFVIFSPVIVPAALTIALAVTGFLTSGAFGITALSSISWIINYFRQVRGSMPQQVEHAKRRGQETATHVGQRVKDVGHKTQEATRT